MVPAVLALVVLSAPATPASPAGPVTRITHAEPAGPAPTALAGVDDVVALCQRLTPEERVRPRGDRVQQGEQLATHAAARDQAIVGRYVLTVPAAALAFSPYDGPERTLSVAEPATITLGNGKVRLWPTEERGLPVEVDAAVARRILAAQRQGTLSLRLSFDLSDEATCGADLRGKHYTLGVEPVDWSWLDGDAVLARGGATADRPIMSVAQGAEPRVDVGEPIAGPSDAKRAVLARRADLLACYRQALEKDPALDGLLVVDLGPKVAVSADSTGSAGLGGCVERALGPLAAASRSSVPIRFELVAPGSKAAAIPAAGEAEGTGGGQ
jgi:hypothetical protein